ncbi:metallophosphoesterase [Leptothrix sp. BB-4]
MFKELPAGPLDIVGDIHGELPALMALLGHLGYSKSGDHPEGRRLVFVGDLVDRGPDSPGVVRIVQRIVESGRGAAILGNHELNLLREQKKDGNDWFWNHGTERDRKYEPTVKAAAEERESLLSFLASLPVTLEREDLRVVHAAWHDGALSALADQAHEPVVALYQAYEQRAEAEMACSGLAARAKAEKEAWKHALDDISQEVPLLHAIAEADEVHQMGNPIKVLTSGVERKGTVPFFSSGKWRFVERVKWWNDYHDDKPVVVGHYWRRIQPVDRMLGGKGDPDLFEGLRPEAWHGARGNVFCVDYSVGGRFKERQGGQLGHTTKLAALRWPERELVLDTGESLPTVGRASA